MSIFTVYLFTRVEALQGLFGQASYLLGLVGLATLIVLGGVYAGFDTQLHGSVQERDRVLKRLYDKLRLALALSTMCAIGKTCTPNQKELAAIVIIPAIANSETLSEIGAEIKDLGLTWLNELKPSAHTPTPEQIDD